MGATPTQPRNKWKPRKYVGLVGGQASITYPNGLIVKFGLVAYTGSPQTLTFTVAFPNACDNVQVTRLRNAGNDSDVNVLNVGVASFQILNGISSSVYWEAKGW